MASIIGVAGVGKNTSQFLGASNKYIKIIDGNERKQNVRIIDKNL